MIETVSVKHNERFELSDKRIFKFKPGLNLILGPNTSGKTSLLTAIKYHCCCEDTYGFCHNNFCNKDTFNRLLKDFPAKVTGKISKTFLYRPEELKENFDCGHSDIGTLRMLQARFESNGEGRYNYHEKFIKQLTDNNKWTSLEKERAVENNIDIDNNVLILFDEPENSMAINMQFGLFDWLYEFAKSSSRLQLIITTHSIAAFGLTKKEDVNTIEMTNGWIDKIINETKERLYL